MAIPSFFKQNKPRGFNYTPRYYDPVKEEMEQRRRRWAAEKDPADTGQEKHGNEPSFAEATDRGRSSSAEATDRGRSSSSEAADRGRSSSSEAAEDGARQPYRSRIMRGDMKNFFPHRQERVRKQTTIRLLVIILIIVFVVYLYLRF